MGDKRTDSGQYYPGGKVVSQHGVAPPQIIVQWSDVQGKPQIAPLPDRYRDGDVKEKVNEIASKFATALAVALVGLTAFAGLVVQKAPKENVWNDEEIVTNAYLTGENASGSVRTLPKYLWLADFDDSYPDDAAWYYRQPQDYGHCSSVRNGNTYSRNLDWKFNSMAEVIIRMSAGQGRFASLGVANVGTNLTEEILASGAPTRYVKALPGHTVDGINERGVVCNVNVVDGPITGWNGGDIHPLGAVRWVLDHATSALDAATNLAARIGFPQGLSQNFHWMVADADTTYIVENGDFKKVTGRAVMTNFPLIDRVDGTGLERYNLLMSPTANITNAWWTLAYIPATSPRRYTDLETTDESVISQIFGAWANGGRESHRGQTYGGNGWWQTVHTTVYDIENRVMRISVQEKDDWYVFALPSGGKVKSVNRQTGDVTITADGIGALTTNLVGKTIVTGTNTHIRMEAGTKITGTDDATITLGGGTLTVPENLSVTVRGNRTLGIWGITNAYTKTETDAKIEQATPQDYDTVRVNAQAGAAHAERTNNPHGVTATQIGAATTGQLDLKRDLTDNKCYVNGFSAWVLTGSDAPSGDYEAFFRNAHLVIAVGGADYAISRDTVSEDAVLVDDFRVPDGPRWLTITATRSRVVSTNETFVTPSFVTNAAAVAARKAVEGKADRSEIPTVHAWAQEPTKPTYMADEVGAYPAASGQTLQQAVSVISVHLNAEDAKDVITNYDSTVNMPSRRLEYKIPDGPDAGTWRVVWDELTRWNWLTGTYLPSNFYTKADVDARTDHIQWGLFDSQTGNFSPEKTVQISSDRVILCKGASYQRTVTAQGSYWVWTSNEPYSITGVESNGYFRIEDAEGNTTFEIVKGDKVTAAATAGGVSTEQVMGITHLHISYPIEADTHPTLEICNDLKTHDWKAETDGSCLANVTWTGVSGNYSAEVWGKGVEDALFVKATYQRGSDPYVRYAQAIALQTVKIGNTIYYVGTATISGHTVLTLSLTPPAQ